MAKGAARVIGTFNKAERGCNPSIHTCSSCTLPASLCTQALVTRVDEDEVLKAEAVLLMYDRGCSDA